MKVSIFFPIQNNCTSRQIWKIFFVSRQKNTKCMLVSLFWWAIPFSLWIGFDCYLKINDKSIFLEHYLTGNSTLWIEYIFYEKCQTMKFILNFKLMNEKKKVHFWSSHLKFYQMIEWKWYKILWIIQVILSKANHYLKSISFVPIFPLSILCDILLSRSDDLPSDEESVEKKIGNSISRCFICDSWQ